ncbi:MAG: YIP1 family protein [Deltaproteobacteria bacterium]|nr:YIP1 family protein [Deltaproteobacteria bacterium]
MEGIADRVIRAAKLDPQVYEEVEADPRALNQAITVVIASGIAAGIGSIAQSGLAGLFFGTIIALIAWYVWAFITYYVGTKWLPEPQTHATHGELLRAIGFSSAPGLIRVLGVIPFLTNFVFIVSGIWMLAAMVIAVRQALDYKSTARAIGVCLIGWAINIAIIWIFALITRAAGAMT